MNLKITIPDTWQKDDFNEWISKIVDKSIKTKY